MATTYEDGEQIRISRNDIRILTALMVGPMTGYGIARQCQADDVSGLRITNGSLRPVLAQLAEMHCIARVKNDRYYKITPLGLQLLEWELDRLRHLVSLVQSRKRNNC